MSIELCPLLFEPRLLPKLWGGTRLSAWGKPLPRGQAIGESWELFDDELGSARVTAGPAQGRSLRELALAWGPALVPGLGRFPLLVKLLDATEDLSVQVHPDDRVARALHGPKASGKTELWVVLQAEPGACVYNGFKPGTEALDLDRALAAGQVMGLLNKVPVRAGDVIDVPAGRVHALGAGCLVAEIQQNSDHTYRLFDHGRLEAGRPRVLHLDEARHALRFDGLGYGDGRVRPKGRREAWGRRESLVENCHFCVQRWALDAAAPLPPTDRPRVLLSLRGQLRLVWGAEAGMMVPMGGTALIPAGLGLRVEGDPGAVLLSIEPILGSTHSSPSQKDLGC